MDTIMNAWNLAKGLGVVIVGVIAFSGNSAIATNNLNVPTPNTAIKHTTLVNTLNANYSIKQTQNLSVIGKKKTLIASCYPHCP